ncbi:hypothetical protein DL95DRAFT_154179 [Leptodontidium sp. 2 PMI_412]|nr:hypothetical protein DL95DRAFT_154179 [Leptodontidium sp. 2 PMI_412]
MAAAAVPTSASPESSSRIAVSSVLTVALIALIIFVSCFMQRRYPTLTTFRPTRHPYVRGTRQRKDIETFTLESIPIVKYSAVLQRNEQIRVAEDSHPISYTSPLRREVQPKYTYPETAPVATSEEKEEGGTPFRHPGVPNSSNKTSPNMHTIQIRDQSRPGHEPASCSICTEDFLERENVRVLPCGHIYHQRCIDPWLLGFAGTCPLCRIILQDVVSSPASFPEPPEPALLSSESADGPHPRVPAFHRVLR